MKYFKERKRKIDKSFNLSWVYFDNYIDRISDLGSAFFTP